MRLVRPVEDTVDHREAPPHPILPKSISNAEKKVPKEVSNEMKEDSATRVVDDADQWTLHEGNNEDEYEFGDGESVDGTPAAPPIHPPPPTGREYLGSKDLAAFITATPTSSMPRQGSPQRLPPDDVEAAAGNMENGVTTTHRLVEAAATTSLIDGSGMQAQAAFQLASTVLNTDSEEEEEESEVCHGY